MKEMPITSAYETIEDEEAYMSIDASKTKSPTEEDAQRWIEKFNENNAPVAGETELEQLREENRQLRILYQAEKAIREKAELELKEVTSRLPADNAPFDAVEKAAIRAVDLIDIEIQKAMSKFKAAKEE